MSPVKAIFVPIPPRTGTNMLHPRPPPPFVELVGHTGFFIHLPSAVRALIFLARRVQPFFSLVDREVEFCVLMI